MFERDMKHSKGKEWGADICSAEFKNYAYFQTEKYLAVDRRSEALEAIPIGVDRDRLVTRQCDIRDLLIDPASLDLVVSTNTLSHLDPSERVNVVASFIEILKPGGDLLLTIPFVGDAQMHSVDQLLLESFATVKKVRYRNFISNAYELCMNDSKGRLTFECCGGSFRRKLMKAASAGLAAFEWLPLLQRTGSMLYYFARHKRGDSEKT